jgi:hypothetical protein
VSLGSFWHFEGAKSVPRILDAWKYIQQKPAKHRKLHGVTF